jgi:hypothetical protein
MGFTSSGSPQYPLDTAFRTVTAMDFVTTPEPTTVSVLLLGIGALGLGLLPRRD